MMEAKLDSFTVAALGQQRSWREGVAATMIIAAEAPDTQDCLTTECPGW